MYPLFFNTPFGNTFLQLFCSLKPFSPFFLFLPRSFDLKCTIRCKQGESICYTSIRFFTFVRASFAKLFLLHQYLEESLFSSPSFPHFPSWFDRFGFLQLNCRSFGWLLRTILRMTEIGSWFVFFRSNNGVEFCQFVDDSSCVSLEDE